MNKKEIKYILDKCSHIDFPQKGNMSDVSVDVVYLPLYGVLDSSVSKYIGDPKYSFRFLRVAGDYLVNEVYMKKYQDNIMSDVDKVKYLKIHHLDLYNTLSKEYQQHYIQKSIDRKYHVISTIEKEIDKLKRDLNNEYKCFDLDGYLDEIWYITEISEAFDPPLRIINYSPYHNDLVVDDRFFKITANEKGAIKITPDFD